METAGAGILDFERVRGRTVLTRAYAKNPLRVLTPRSTGEFSWAYLSSFGGGMVNGDRVEIDLRVRENAGAVLMTQSATKIYRSPQGTSQTLRCRVGREGVLLNLPDPVICFAGSRFEQRQTYDLDPGASILILDPLVCGRHCRGERWAFERYRSELRVSRNREPLFLDTILLDPAHGTLADRMGRFNSFATLLILGPRFQWHSEEILSALREKPLRVRPDTVFSVNAVKSEGLVMRLASRSTEELLGTIRQFLYFLPEQIGDNPWTRKW